MIAIGADVHKRMCTLATCFDSRVQTADLNDAGPQYHLPQ